MREAAEALEHSLAAGEARMEKMPHAPPRITQPAVAQPSSVDLGSIHSFRPDTFIPWESWATYVLPLELSREEEGLLTWYANQFEPRLAGHQVRGPRGPNCIVYVKDPRLAAAGISGFAFAHATARLAVARIELEKPPGYSRHDIALGEVGRGLKSGTYRRRGLVALLDCEILGALHDMTVCEEGVFELAVTGQFRRMPSQIPTHRRISYVPTSHLTIPEPPSTGLSAARAVTPRYVPFHLRHLPSGQVASAEACGVARQYGFSIPDGDTFVNGYFSPRFADTKDAPNREVRSVGALEVLQAIRRVLSEKYH